MTEREASIFSKIETKFQVSFLNQRPRMQGHFRSLQPLKKIQFNFYILHLCVQIEILVYELNA